MDDEFDAEIAGVRSGSTFEKVYKGEPASRVVLRSAHFVGLVDLAPLVTGHLLVVPKRKVLAFAGLADEEWFDWLVVRERVAAALQQLYGPVCFMEHGSDPAMERAACVLHAHMHVLPFSHDVAESFERDGLEVRGVDPERLRGAVVEGQAYFYAELLGATGRLAEIRAGGWRPPSQYLRRIVTERLGDSDAFDWGVVVRRERLRETVRALAPRLGGDDRYA